MTNLDINGKTVSVDVPADRPLLWALRDELGLTGTKSRLRDFDAPLTSSRMILTIP